MKTATRREENCLYQFEWDYQVAVGVFSIFATAPASYSKEATVHFIPDKKFI